MSITVDMKWSPADNDAGLSGGWDPEDCLVTHEVNGILTIFSFMPDEDDAPRDWPIVQVDTTFRLAGVEHFAHICYTEDPQYWEQGAGKRTLLVGDLPEPMHDAVCAKWEAIQTQEKEQADIEDAWDRAEARRSAEEELAADPFDLSLEQTEEDRKHTAGTPWENA